MSLFWRVVNQRNIRQGEELSWPGRILAVKVLWTGAGARCEDPAAWRDAHLLWCFLLVPPWDGSPVHTDPRSSGWHQSRVSLTKRPFLNYRTNVALEGGTAYAGVRWDVETNFGREAPVFCTSLQESCPACKQRVSIAQKAFWLKLGLSYIYWSVQVNIVKVLWYLVYQFVLSEY